MKSGHIDKAAIISVAGDSVWASSAGFTVRHHSTPIPHPQVPPCIISNDADLASVAKMGNGEKKTEKGSFADQYHYSLSPKR